MTIELGRLLLDCVEIRDRTHTGAVLAVPDPARLGVVADWLEEHDPLPVRLHDVGVYSHWGQLVGPEAAGSISLAEVARAVLAPWPGALRANRQGEVKGQVEFVVGDSSQVTLRWNGTRQRWDGKFLFRLNVSLIVSIRAIGLFSQHADFLGDVNTWSFSTETPRPTLAELDHMDHALDHPNLVRWHALRSLCGWPIEKLMLMHREGRAA